MLRTITTALALSALILISQAPEASASPRAVYYNTARSAAYAPVYGGTWRGNTYYAAATRWGGSLDAQLFAAAANGDLWMAKRLVERGANVDARDQDGLAPLAWASQYGRTDLARYLLDQHANLNPADRHGYTPLMWAAQEGHQGTIDLLLARGANAHVINRNGVTAYTLARYSGSWRAAESLESWLSGRTLNTRPAAGKPLVPSRVTTIRPVVRQAIAAAPVLATPVAAPTLTAPVTALVAPAEPGMLAKAMAFKRLGETGVAFGDDFSNYVKASTSGGFNMNMLAAATSPDMETGKLLATFFANVGKSQDLRAARADLERAKASLQGRPDARFARFVGDADKALVEAGI